MTFAQPWLLLFGMLPLAAFGLWVWGTRRGASGARRLSRDARPRRPWFAALLIAVAAMAGTVAAAQPRWGTTDAAVPRTGSQVVFVLDVSRSMAARDVSPNRLEAAKGAITAAINRLGGDRVGLVIYGGSARLRFPLTSDFAAASRVLGQLEPGGLLVEGGSAAGNGLDVALAAFDEQSQAGRLIVLISDGEDLGADPAAVTGRLRDSGASLVIAGVGTSTGATIPVFDPQTGTTVDRLDASGAPIITRLDETFLRGLATAGDGRYIGSDLRLLAGTVEGRVAALKRATFDERPTKLPVERYQWFAGAACALLGLALVGRSLQFARREALAASSAALAMLLAGCATEAHTLNRDGLNAFKRGDFAAAEERFIEAQAAAPDEARITLNLAAAQHAMGRYDEAVLTARRALNSPSAGIRARAYASIGHHRFAQDDLPAALGAFKQALLEDPDDDLSRRDYEVVYRLLNPGPAEPAEPGDQGGAAPTPGASPGAGGTEPAGGDGDPNATPQSGPSGSDSDGGGPRVSTPQEADRLIAELDRRIQSLLREAGDDLTAAQALQILRLIDERDRLAAQRDAFNRRSNPNDR
jgi:Ca-activated chloride channel family protein